LAKKAVFCWRILSIFVAGLIYQKIYPKNHRCFGNAYIAWTGEAFETDWKTRHAEAQRPVWKTCSFVEKPVF